MEIGGDGGDSTNFRGGMYTSNTSDIVMDGETGAYHTKIGGTFADQIGRDGESCGEVNISGGITVFAYGGGGGSGAMGSSNNAKGGGRRWRWISSSWNRWRWSWRRWS